MPKKKVVSVDRVTVRVDDSVGYKDALELAVEASGGGVLSKVRTRRVRTLAEYGNRSHPRRTIGRRLRRSFTFTR